MKSIYIILVFAFFISACGSKQDKKGQEPVQQQQTKAKGNTIVFTPEQSKNGGVDTGILPTHLLTTAIHVNGQVDVPPENLIAVNVPMGGFLKKITLLPGEHVVKGQIIAQIENQDYITIQQDYLTTISKITYLKQELERQKILSQQQASPLKLYQQSQADYSSQVAQAAGLAQKLKLIGINPNSLTPSTIRSTLSIHSPITGYVSQVNVSVGRFINPTDILMELVDTDDIHAALTVFEQDIAKISIGNAVKINLPSVPDKTYPGKVILIGRVLDTSRSVMVHCHFLKTDKNLLPNMFIQATIESKPQKTLAVPDAALVNYSGQKGIFIATKSGKNISYSLLPVEVGVQQDGWNEIKLSKPELQDKIFVLKGAFSILSAMKNTGDDSE
jgi:cobalt-zinc-cadmium efflux system membrane fusion protein